MSTTEMSATYIVSSDSNIIGDDTNKLSEICIYLNNRIMEIEERIATGKRSIFDFVDIAVIIGTIASLIGSQSKLDTDQYIDFVRNELLPANETNKTMIATAFYCLMRCGLVHEMSLAGHNIRPCRKTAINGYGVALTHDYSADGNWYSVNQSEMQIVFYAHELVTKTKNYIASCFIPNSPFESVIKAKLSSGGISIVAIKS